MDLLVEDPLLIDNPLIEKGAFCADDFRVFSLSCTETYDCSETCLTPPAPSQRSRSRRLRKHAAEFIQCTGLTYKFLLDGGFLDVCISDAASRLGFDIAYLKKLSRKFFPRWPFRKRNMLIVALRNAHIAYEGPELKRVSSILQKELDIVSLNKNKSYSASCQARAIAGKISASMRTKGHYMRKKYKEE